MHNVGYNIAAVANSFSQGKVNTLYCYCCLTESHHEDLAGSQYFCCQSDGSPFSISSFEITVLAASVFLNGVTRGLFGLKYFFFLFPFLTSSRRYEENNPKKVFIDFLQPLQINEILKKKKKKSGTIIIIFCCLLSLVVKA